jgi:hypothetical protein
MSLRNGAVSLKHTIHICYHYRECRYDPIRVIDLSDHFLYVMLAVRGNLFLGNFAKEERLNRLDLMDRKRESTHQSQGEHRVPVTNENAHLPGAD